MEHRSFFPNNSQKVELSVQVSILSVVLIFFLFYDKAKPLKFLEEKQMKAVFKEN